MNVVKTHYNRQKLTVANIPTSISLKSADFYLPHCQPKGSPRDPAGLVIKTSGGKNGPMGALLTISTPIREEVSCEGRRGESWWWCWSPHVWSDRHTDRRTPANPASQSFRVSVKLTVVEGGSVCVCASGVFGYRTRLYLNTASQ